MQAVDESKYIAPPAIEVVFKLKGIAEQLIAKLDGGHKPDNIRTEILSPLFSHCPAAVKSFNSREPYLAIETALIMYESNHGAPRADIRQLKNFRDGPLKTMIHAATLWPTTFATPLPVVHPLLAKGTQAPNFLVTASMSFTKLECLVILSCAFLCLFPRESYNCVNETQDLPSINFDEMMFTPARGDTNSVEVAKLLMILDYFDEMTKRLNPSHPLHDTMTRADCSVTIERRAIDDNAALTQLGTAPLAPCVVHDLKESIDDQKAMIRADFANQVIGGGAIAYGCVQEEIMFSICPELIVSRLFHTAMQPNEAIIFYGSEQFSQPHPGTYAFSLRHGGPFADTKLPNNSVVSAIDALDFRYGGRGSYQFQADQVRREIVKALAGFYFPQGAAFPHGQGNEAPARLLPQEVATGNWGCGAFLGDPTLKIVLQWIAISMAGKTMHYFPFTDGRLLAFRDLSAQLVAKGVTCADLLDALRRGLLMPDMRNTLFDQIRRCYGLDEPK